MDLPRSSPGRQADSQRAFRAGVAQIRFVAGRLALPSAKKDNVSGTMLFDRRTAK